LPHLRRTGTAKLTCRVPRLSRFRDQRSLQL
jgi:hypothetical protein